MTAPAAPMPMPAPAPAPAVPSPRPTSTTAKTPDKRIQWGPGREDAFKAYAEAELTQALSARAALERKWQQWLEQYRPSATQPVKDFPFPGASNRVMPVTAIDVDQLYAKFIQTIHAPRNLWTIEALNPDWVAAAKPIQDFLQWLDGAVLRMEDVNKRAFLELVKLGTAIYKTDWLYERRNTWTYDGTGGRTRTDRVISHPIVDHVRLVDFIIPAYAYAIQADDQGGAPWVAERHRIGVSRLQAIADATEPYLPNYGRMGVEKIREWVIRSQLPHDDTIQNLDYQQSIAGAPGGQTFELAVGQATNHSPSGAGTQPKDEVEIFEIHARFACEREGGSESDIVVEYHIPTQTIIRGTYLRYHHGKRPYSKCVYFPTEGFYGIGVCEQKEVFQELESDLSNYTADNVLLANATCIAAKQGSSIAPGEPWFPGKTVFTDGNPKEEIFPFQLGAGVYPGLDRLREQYRFTGRERTGVSDLNSGNIQSLPSRTPATTVQSLLEEGARRPDLTLKDLRACLSEIGLRVIQLIQQHAQPLVAADGEKWLTAALQVLGNEAGLEVVKKLAMPLSQAEYGLGVNLTATSATANKEVAKQAFMGLIQLKQQVGPWYTQLMQMALQFQGTPLGQVALDNLQGMAYLEKRLLEQFDVRNITEVVPQIPKDPVQAITDPLAALQLLPGGGPAAGGLASASGVEAPAGPAGAGGAGGV